MHELEPRVLKLATDLPSVAEEVRLAYAYVARDPASSLTKSRIVMEKLLVELYTGEMGKEPRKSMIAEIFSDNQFTRRIERRILARMNAVRDMGNLGPHGENVEPVDAERALDDLCTVVDWYVRRTGSGLVLSEQPQVRRPRRQVPALLHYHCDRLEQEHQIEDALKCSGSDGPLVFIVHGDEYQCHDKFLERLSLVSLPRILGLDRERIGVKEYMINFPSALSDADKFREQLLKNLGLRVLNRGTASADEIAGLFGRLAIPVIVQARLLTDEWIRGGRAILSSFLDFWMQWPARDARFRPLIFLVVTYHLPMGRGWFRWYRRIEFQRANARLRSFLGSMARASGPSGPVVLDELRGVTQNDIEVWARDMYTQQFCGERDLLAEVRDLCRRPGFRDREGRVSMELIAEELKRLLGPGVAGSEGG